MSIFELKKLTAMCSEFYRGGDSLQVPLAMHAENRMRFFSTYNFPSPQHILLVYGGEEISMYNSDTAFDSFRQESYFQWLVGAKEPGLALVMFTDSRGCQSILFIPEFPASYETWMGPRRSPDWYKQTYGVDKVMYFEDLDKIVENREILVIGNEKALNHSGQIDKENSVEVGHILDELRAVKTNAEISILQFVNNVSCHAHIQVMLEIYKQIPRASREYFAEAVFRYACALKGCARVGYTCIACSGERNAILHYGHPAEPNNEEVPSTPHLRLLDMGAEYHCYTADVTNTFPSNGRFSDLQRAVYLCVWDTVLFVERKLRPSANYRDIHISAQKHLLEGLINRTELIKPQFRDQIDFLASELNIIPRLFMPHGLGHMLGLNVHDVGGYLPGDRKNPDDISVRGLRLSRPLLEGFVLTVEPGIYFIDYIKEECLKDAQIAAVIDWDVW
ncbi:hypothetical protein C9890_0289 [Perkinsus sp. BL_2016]|nr:hypothetical protein C9890_0289 [Perkinsus sp. BL_2016]